ncbi:MAG: hypothetical protein M3O87_08105 [Candidatus Dormibacteraeota bacterium]|nr:hypothetical protein [Candidatus Dormibacteraeota bacterium]
MGLKGLVAAVAVIAALGPVAASADYQPLPPGQPINQPPNGQTCTVTNNGTGMSCQPIPAVATSPSPPRPPGRTAAHPARPPRLAAAAPAVTPADPMKPGKMGGLLAG